MIFVVERLCDFFRGCMILLVDWLRVFLRGEVEFCCVIFLEVA